MRDDDDNGNSKGNVIDDDRGEERLTQCEKDLISFMSYVRAHPEERFWEALRNWSRWDYILVTRAIDVTLEYGKMYDTFYWMSTRRPPMLDGPIPRSETEIRNPDDSPLGSPDLGLQTWW